MDEIGRLSEDRRNLFLKIQGQVARKIREYFIEQDIEIMNAVKDNQVNSKPYQIHVSFLEEKLGEENCVVAVAGNLIHHIKKHQNDPKRVFIFKLAEPDNVEFAYTCYCDGVYLRGVADYFLPTDSIMCRFDILYC